MFDLFLEVSLVDMIYGNTEVQYSTFISPGLYDCKSVDVIEAVCA